MPDAFGNPTPQEVLQNIRLQARDTFFGAQKSGSPGLQAGASLAAIFGPSIAKTLDTRSARNVFAERIMQADDSMTPEQARDIAKVRVPREYSAVRKARQINEAYGDIQTFIDSMPETVPRDQRMANAKLIVAERLRSMGMVDQANALALEGHTEMIAAEDAQAQRKKLAADLKKTQVDTERAEAELEFVGTTPHAKNLLQRERLYAQLNDPNSLLTEDKRDSLLRMIGHLDAKMLKDETILGRTEHDVRNDPVLMRKLFSDLADNQVLINGIDDATLMLDDLDNFEVTFWASAKKDFLGFAQRWFGREPSETDQEFMQRITEKEGLPTLIAAKIRHALTGAQMSAFEIQYLTPFLPSPDDSVEVMKHKMRVIRDYTQMDTDTRMAMFQSGATDAWFGNHSPASADNPLGGKPTDVSPEAADAANSILPGIWGEEP